MPRPPADSDQLANSPTLASPVMTEVGTVLGTAAYMSPEQARGKAVDKRTDVWSFGCVLYEMLTGAPAFPGETVADCVASIIERSPDFDALPDDLPASVRVLVRRCLAKDAKERLRDIGDARIEIGHALAAPTTAEAHQHTDGGAARDRRVADPAQDEERRQQARIEGCKLAGLIIAASGLGTGPLLYGLAPDSGVYLVAAAPLAVGTALLLYGFVLAPRSAAGGQRR